MGRCFAAPLGILWEFLSCFALQLVFNPQILLLLCEEKELKKCAMLVWIVLTQLCPGFVNNCMWFVLSIISGKIIQSFILDHCVWQNDTTRHPHCRLKTPNVNLMVVLETMWADQHSHEDTSYVKPWMPLYIFVQKFSYSCYDSQEFLPHPLQHRHLGKKN